MTTTVTGQLFKTPPRTGTVAARKVVVAVGLNTAVGFIAGSVGFKIVPNGPCVPIETRTSPTPPAVNVTDWPTQIADCDAVSVNKGVLLTVTETTAVVVQVGLVTITVNVLTPASKLLAVALAVVWPVSETPTGPLSV